MYGDSCDLGRPGVLDGRSGAWLRWHIEGLLTSDTRISRMLRLLHPPNPTQP